MNFEEWKRGVPERVKAEPEWKFYAYPRALFLYDLVWNDCERLVQEGYGRGIGTKSYLYLIRVAIGSARETKGWYYRSRHLLSAEVLEHRLALADEIIALLATEIARHQKRHS